MYGKIFDSMYEGTLYGHWEAIVTLQQMIVLCDADGIVDMTPQAIAARTSIPLEIIQKGIQVLSEPDPYSRTPGAEGRRIELIDGHRPWGWHLINHEKYKRMQDADTIRQQTRDRVRRHREAKAAETAGNDGVTVGNGQKRHTDTDTNTKNKKLLSGDAGRFPGFDRFWKAWPVTARKGGKAKCLSIWKRKGLEAKADAIVAHVEKMKASDDWRGGFEPMPTTYLNQDRWDGADLDAPEPGKKPWFINGWSGIVAEGLKLGLHEADYDNPPAFRAAVLQKAGITAEQVKKAEAEWRT